MKKLVVQLVTWNGEKYIPHLFDSLKKQTLADDEWKLVILDNNSEDNTVEVIKKELADFSVEHVLQTETENFGFAGGHNQLFKKYASDYIVLLNQDLYPTENCLSHMLDFMERTNTAGVVSPRLMRWDFDKIADEGLSYSFSEYVDALGLQVFRNRRVIERETQQLWSDIHGNYQKNVIEVFGVSGTLPMYRRDVLEKIAFEDGTFLDETYHSYKEDVDLAYRLQHIQSGAYILRDTIAYHDRSAAGPSELHDRAAVKNKKAQSSWVTYHSYKNHIVTLIKNEYPENFFLDFLWIFWYEFKKFGYFLLFDRSVLKGLGELRAHMGLYIARRRKIHTRKSKSWRDMREWWTKSDK